MDSHECNCHMQHPTTGLTFMPQTLATVAAKLSGETWMASHTRRAIGSDSGDLDLDFDDVFGKPGSREEGGTLSAAPSVEVGRHCMRMCDLRSNCFHIVLILLHQLAVAFMNLQHQGAPSCPTGCFAATAPLLVSFALQSPSAGVSQAEAALLNAHSLEETLADGGMVATRCRLNLTASHHSLLSCRQAADRQ